LSAPRGADQKGDEREQRDDQAEAEEQLAASGGDGATGSP